LELLQGSVRWSSQLPPPTPSSGMVLDIFRHPAPGLKN
jgi:hypothetical protein